MNLFIRHTLFILIAAMPGILQAYSIDETEVTIRFQPDEILIGQPSTMEILVNIPEGGILIWPGPEEIETNKIEILRYGLADTLEHDPDRVRMMQQHSITSWEEGFIPIPPIAFTLIKENDTLFIESKAKLLTVKGVDVDMMEAYKDIKPLVGFPVTFREVLPYILTVALLAIVLYFIVRYLKKRKKPAEEPTIWEKPEVPAHIAAISSLETLRRKELWQQGAIKAYYSELSTILRKYLYKRFRLDAMELTTREIMHYVPGHIESESLLNELKTILELADMVKFAKFYPEEKEHDLMLNKALDFVKKTANVSSEE